MSEPHEAWVEMAEEDWYLAEAVDARRAPRGGCFHAQQCIEKYLKAALVQRGLEVERTHGLEALGERLTEVDGAFGVLMDPLERLNPHAVLTRCALVGPSAEDAEAALAAMRWLRSEVRRLLSLDDVPG